MPDPAGDGAGTSKARNGDASPEFLELRRLLIGDELADLAGIKQHLDDPARRTADVAEILPDAIRKAPGKALRTAIEPVFEKSFQNSVRKHPRELAEAIYPVIGPAIRKSIAAAIREFAESLNQVVEKSASLRSIKWRIQARLSGKPFSEILLAKSLLYRVEQVFLIHKKGGLLLQHVAARDSIVKDADMISGMLTAIQDFVSDSFVEGQELETLDVGRFRLWIQHGPKALLVGAVSGSAPVGLKRVFRDALDRIHEALWSDLDTFKQEDLSVFEPARPYLEACLLGSSKQARRRPVLRWVLAASIFVLLVAAAVYWIRTPSRWDRYVAELRQQPGVVLTRIDKGWGSYVVAGLKDPKAADPSALLARHGLDAAKVKFEWEPYHSLNSRFASERELEAARTQLESHIIRFDVGSSRLPAGAADRLEAAAAAIRPLLQSYPESRVTVTGHTDEIGTLEMNSKLSRDRAGQVVLALTALGGPPGRLEIVGAGNADPVRRGETEWDRAANRSVTFRVTGIAQTGNR